MDAQAQRRYHEEREYENQENARQSALDAERAVWMDAVVTLLQESKNAGVAIKIADEVLAAYRERFS